MQISPSRVLFSRGRDCRDNPIQARPAMVVPLPLSPSSAVAPMCSSCPCCCSMSGMMLTTTTLMTSSSSKSKSTRRTRMGSPSTPRAAALVAAEAAEQGRGTSSYAIQLFQESSSRDRANDMQAEARAMARAAEASVYSPQLLSLRYGSRPIKVLPLLFLFLFTTRAISLKFLGRSSPFISFVHLFTRTLATAQTINAKFQSIPFLFD